MSSRSEPPAAPGPSVPISALQHWIFCPRQWGLIHLDRIWAENRATAEGRLMHAAADGGGAERRPGLRILRAVALRSDRHGLHGVADVVELRGGAPMPVEYKRGRPKAHRADEVQLCAQAMCLEDMFGCAIPEGELFYGAQRRRVPVTLDPALRGMVLDAAGAIRAATAAGRAPPPVHAERKCAQCSLVEACRPRRLGNPGSVARWLRAQLAAEGAPE